MKIYVLYDREMNRYYNSDGCTTTEMQNATIFNDLKIAESYCEDANDFVYDHFVVLEMEITLENFHPLECKNAS